MSTVQKVGQLFVAVIHGSSADTLHPSNREEYGLDTPAELVQHYLPGGVIHLSRDGSPHEPERVARLSNGLQHAAVTSPTGIPLSISADQEQGAVTRIAAPATRLPGNMALGASRSARSAYRAAAITARELRAMGVTHALAPVADVNVDPRNPVIGTRSFSADPDLAARLTAAQVHGLQESGGPGHNVSAVVKHFPGHGDTGRDSHTSLPIIEHTARQWRRLDAPPFRAAVAAGVDSVMSAHIVMPALDGSGSPATLSPEILTGRLRGELGFEGVVITDSLRMEAVRALHSGGSVAVRALRAGADQLLMPESLPAAFDSVLRAVRSGEIDEQRVDTSVRRILLMKARRGILADPFVDVSRVPEVVGTAHHRQQAQRITDGTITVLDNRAGLLPLQHVPERVLVTGRSEQAAVATASGFGERGAATTVLPTGRAPDREPIEQARKHELTVVLTSSAWREEDPAQLDLVRALARSGVRLVAVAVGDPHDAAHAREARTWLATYSTQAVSMESVVRVLFAEIAPSGTLPVSVPDPDDPTRPHRPLGHGLSLPPPRPAGR